MLAVASGAAKTGLLEKIQDEFVGDKHAVGVEAVASLEATAHSQVSVQLEKAKNSGLQFKKTSGGFEVVEPNAADNQEPVIEVSGRRQWATVTTHNGPVSVEYRFTDSEGEINPNNVDSVLAKATFDNATIEDVGTDREVQVTLQEDGEISLRGADYSNPDAALAAAKDIITGHTPNDPIDLDNAGWDR